MSDVMMSTAPLDSVDQILEKTLGVPLGDSNRFRRALDQRFPIQTDPATGHATIRYVPSSYTVESFEDESLPPSGPLASIQAQATLLVEEAVQVLDRLGGIDCCAQPGLDALRDLIRDSLRALPRLLTAYGGPNATRVNLLFKRLLGNSSEEPDADSQLGRLEQHLHIETESGTVETETVATDFHILRDYVRLLRSSWTCLDNHADDSLVSLIRRIGLRLRTVRHSVGDLVAALDETHLGAAERNTIVLQPSKISVADVLSWIEDMASPATFLLIAGGRVGIETSFAPQIGELKDIVCTELKPLLSIGGQPTPREGETSQPTCEPWGGDLSFIATARTEAAVTKLGSQLADLVKLVKEKE